MNSQYHKLILRRKFSQKFGRKTKETAMSSITEDLKQTFDLASLRQKAKSLTRPADWGKANEITKRYARENSKQTKLYNRDYKSRVEKALQARINKAGAKNLTLKHRLFGSDNFDNVALTRQAHRDVHHDHSRRMSHLKAQESQELNVWFQPPNNAMPRNSICTKKSATIFDAPQISVQGWIGGGRDSVPRNDQFKTIN